LSLSRGGEVPSLVRRRNRRKILIAFDGFLPAKLAAGENEDDSHRGDDAADDNSEFSASIIVHDIHSTFAARTWFRCRVMRAKIGRNRREIWAIWRYWSAWITIQLC
jgi:hypothetical protein